MIIIILITIIIVISLFITFHHHHHHHQQQQQQQQQHHHLLFSSSSSVILIVIIIIIAIINIIIIIIILGFQPPQRCSPNHRIHRCPGITFPALTESCLGGLAGWSPSVLGTQWGLLVPAQLVTSRCHHIENHHPALRIPFSAGWWFQTWTDYFHLFSISYMGCHPKPIDELIFFKMVIAPPTRHHHGCLWQHVVSLRPTCWIRSVVRQPGISARGPQRLLAYNPYEYPWIL